MILGILVLFGFLIVLPLAVGMCFRGTENVNHSMIYVWICGQMILWAGFLTISIPFILKGRDLKEVIVAYGGFCALAALTSLGVCLKNKISLRPGFQKGKQEHVLLWGIVIALLVLQMVLAATLAYEEGDDAFYVAVSTLTKESGKMYQVLPYTGQTTGLDARHGLAPLPIWIAMLSRLSGIHAAIMNQIILPVLFIPVAYGIMYLIGNHLFEGDRKKLGIFLLVEEFVVLFGGQSLYTSENFLLVRTAQGKAVLACIIIPFLLYLLFALADRCKTGKSTRFLWLIIAATMMAGCLCSTQGALLDCILLGLGGALLAFLYRRYRLLVPTVICCVIPTGMAVLYLILG